MNPPPTAAGGAGKRLPRVDDPRLLTGNGQYIADVVIPGMQHAAFVRSRYARARIRAIRADEARAATGVAAVLTGEDLNPHLAGDMHATMYLGHASHAPLMPLAQGTVNYVGQPVAVVVATDRYLAEDAAELVEIDYEPLPPILDYLHAQNDTDHLVHPDRATNIAEQTGVPIDAELEAIFEGAPHVFKQTFRQHRQTPVPMETRGVIAQWTPSSGQLRVHIASQFPHEVRAVSSRITGVPLNRVRVVVGDVGGSFGQKSYMPLEEQTIVLAARVLGRTVRWIEDRGENLTASTQSRHEQMSVRMAVDDDGIILGAHVEHVADIGAHPVFTTGGGAVFVCMVFPGPYRIPKYAFRSTSVFTNTLSRAAYRGPWQIESVAREAMMDLMARQLEIDPIELRRRNVLRRTDLPYDSPGGLTIDAVSPAETLDDAVRLVDYEQFRTEQQHARTQGRLIGMGTGLIVEPQPGQSAGTDGVAIRLTPSGQVEVAQPSGDHGQGLTTTTSQLVANVLGVDTRDIAVLQGDTAVSPFGAGTGGSRSGPMLGAAVLQAAEELRRRIIKHAARLIDVAPEQIELTEGMARKAGTSSPAVTLAEIATSAYAVAPGASADSALNVVSQFNPPVAFTFSNACHICTVEVDQFTGKTTILRYVVSEDCGEMINPGIVDGQISGGIMQGIAGALYEHIVSDDSGRPVTATLADYLVPTIAEAPHIEIHHLSTPGMTPGNFKGVGEGGVIGAVPAVLNAVADALAQIGATITDQPLTPPKVLAAIDAREQQLSPAVTPHR